MIAVQRWILVVGMLVFVLITGCLLEQIEPSPDPESTTVPSLVPPPVFAGWDALQPGIELRTAALEALTGFTVLRIDPSQVRFRVHYRPGQPLTLDNWRAELPDALAIINANFFDPENNVLGLLIVDGVVYGVPYTERGGIFAVEGEMVRVRSTVREPYRGEVLDQAVQAFPMLVLDGMQAYTSTSGGRPARRSVIAQDRAGNILLMASSLFGPRLADMSAALAESDLDIQIAFNLDGGGSTMLYAAGDESPVVLPSFDPVPAVLAVYGR